MHRRSSDSPPPARAPDLAEDRQEELFEQNIERQKRIDAERRRARQEKNAQAEKSLSSSSPAVPSLPLPPPIARRPLVKPQPIDEQENAKGSIPQPSRPLSLTSPSIDPSPPQYSRGLSQPQIVDSPQPSRSLSPAPAADEDAGRRRKKRLNSVELDDLETKLPGRVYVKHGYVRFETLIKHMAAEEASGHARIWTAGARHRLGHILDQFRLDRAIRVQSKALLKWARSGRTSKGHQGIGKKMKTKMKGGVKALTGLMVHAVENTAQLGERMARGVGDGVGKVAGAIKGVKSGRGSLNEAAAAHAEGEDVAVRPGLGPPVTAFMVPESERLIYVDSAGRQYDFVQGCSRHYMENNVDTRFLTVAQRLFSDELSIATVNAIRALIDTEMGQADVMAQLELVDQYLTEHREETKRYNEAMGMANIKMEINIYELQARLEALVAKRRQQPRSAQPAAQGVEGLEAAPAVACHVRIHLHEYLDAAVRCLASANMADANTAKHYMGYLRDVCLHGLLAYPDELRLLKLFIRYYLSLTTHDLATATERVIELLDRLPPERRDSQLEYEMAHAYETRWAEVQEVLMSSQTALAAINHYNISHQKSADEPESLGFPKLRQILIEIARFQKEYREANKSVAREKMREEKDRIRKLIMELCSRLQHYEKRYPAVVKNKYFHLNYALGLFGLGPGAFAEANGHLERFCEYIENAAGKGDSAHGRPAKNAHNNPNSHNPFGRPAPLPGLAHVDPQNFEFENTLRWSCEKLVRLILFSGVPLPSVEHEAAGGGAGGFTAREDYNEPSSRRAGGSVPPSPRDRAVAAQGQRGRLDAVAEERVGRRLGKNRVHPHPAAADEADEGDDEDEGLADPVAPPPRLGLAALGRVPSIRLAAAMAFTSHPSAPSSVRSARRDPSQPPPEWHYGWQSLWRLCKRFDVNLTARLLASWHRGRVGLSLSGGGLRASFVHLGLLARLAECDMLFSVESIASVSGGSIVLAQYYLFLRELLESKPDESITRDDYIAVVKRTITNFCGIDDDDLYNRVLLYPWENVKVHLFNSFSRAHQMAERFRAMFGNAFYGEEYRMTKEDIERQKKQIEEEERTKENELAEAGAGMGSLYTGSEAAAPSSLESARELAQSLEGGRQRLRDLVVKPQGWNHGPFRPRHHNWRRTAKVPAIYIHATTVNTGHLWRFSATRMGESQEMFDPKFDHKRLLSEVKYTDLKIEHDDLSLPFAVATSAGVPGFFKPLMIENMFHKMNVRLIDGGVYDNQGLQSLYYDSSDIIICSDASNQMQDEENPSTSSLSVVQRSLDIAMDQVYERGYVELKRKEKNQEIDGFMFINLKQKIREAALLKPYPDLPNGPMRVVQSAAVGQANFASADPAGAKAATAAAAVDPEDDSIQTKSVYEHIAAFRSALDRFTEVERSALMYVGYSLTAESLEQKARSEGEYVARVKTAEEAESTDDEENTEDDEDENQLAVGARRRRFKDADISRFEQMESMVAAADDDGGAHEDRAAAVALAAHQAALVKKPTLRYSLWKNFPLMPSVASRWRFMKIKPVMEREEEKGNEAVKSLKRQLYRGKMQFAWQRVYAILPKWPFVYGFIALLLALTLLIIYEIIIAFSDNHTVCADSLYSSPGYYLLICLAIIFFGIYPGWASSLAFAFVLIPMYALFNLYALNPILARYGRMSKLLGKHHEHLKAEQADKEMAATVKAANAEQEKMRRLNNRNRRSLFGGSGHNHAEAAPVQASEEEQDDEE